MQYREAPGQWHSLPPMFCRYREGDDALAGFFNYDHRAPAEWQRRLGYLESRRGAGREQVAQALVARNRGLGAGPRSLAAAASLGRQGSVAVVAGQQAGVLTGPLFTIYKAVTAVAAARWAEQLLGRPVVPVFWVASDDHDFAEIASIYAMATRGEIRKLQLEYRHPTADCISHIPVPAAAWQLIGRLQEVMGPGPAADQLARDLGEAAAASSSLAEWFSRLLIRAMGDRGLVVLDPAWPELRGLLTPFFHQALLHSHAVTAELTAAGERLESRGFAVALRPDRGSSHLFLRVDGNRSGLLWQGGELVDRAGRLREPLSHRDAIRAAVSAPGDLSPDAALRPVAQEHLLPVLAQVVGPGETAYLAQARQVYPLFGHEMPVLMPRLSVTLVEPDQQLTLERHSLQPEEIPGQIQRRLDMYLAQLDEVGVEDMFAGLRCGVEQLYAERMEGLGRINRGLQELAEVNLRHVLGQVDYLERKALGHRRRRYRELADAFRRLAGLLPAGRPQERLFNIFPYLARYGPGLIDGLLQLPLGRGHLLGLVEAGDG